MFFKIECVSIESAKQCLKKAISLQGSGVIAASRFDSAVVIDLEEERLGVLGRIQANHGHTTRCTSDDISSVREQWCNKYGQVPPVDLEGMTTQ